MGDRISTDQKEWELAIRNAAWPARPKGKDNPEAKITEAHSQY